MTIGTYVLPVFYVIAIMALSIRRAMRFHEIDSEGFLKQLAAADKNMSNIAEIRGTPRSRTTPDQIALRELLYQGRKESNADRIMRAHRELTNGKRMLDRRGHKIFMFFVLATCVANFVTIGYSVYFNTAPWIAGASIITITTTCFADFVTRQSTFTRIRTDRAHVERIDKLLP